jgi:hypothetical protein
LKTSLSAKFHALLLSLLIIAGFLFLESFSLLTHSVVIKNTGQISLLNVTAKSGYWRDIQDAINRVIAQGGVGNVYIPEGTWNFVNLGESWTGVARVTIPAGVNLFGAPTIRDEAGNVIEWKTVLIIPWDMPASFKEGQQGYPTPYWFQILGNGDLNKPTRVSDIKFVGYRYFDSDSIQVTQGFYIEAVMDFRIDHCCFQDICGGALDIYGGYGIWKVRGVVDHCIFNNTKGHVEDAMVECTVGYGIVIGRGYGDLWEDNVTKVLGKYTDHSVFIENCYFSKWRHCVAANNGAHYVFRHNIIEYDFGYGSLDAHGWGVWSNGRVDEVGTRGVEVYDNLFKDPIWYNEVLSIRGGAGVAFNNILIGDWVRFLWFTNEADPRVSKCWVHDWYIWNNTLNPGCVLVTEYDPDDTIHEGIDYFYYRPDWYQPYPYPHYLTYKV